MHEEYSVFKLPEMEEIETAKTANEVGDDSEIGETSEILGELATELKIATEKDVATDDSLAVYEELTAIAEEIEKCRGEALMI